MALLTGLLNNKMTLTEAIQQGYEVRIKTGYVGDQFIRNWFTLMVEVRKDNIRGSGYIACMEEFLEDAPNLQYLIDTLIKDAILDWHNKHESN